MLQIGTTIGELTITRELAQGGMGLLYLARDRVLDTQHVVKVLQAHLSRNELMVQRFVNEGRAAAAIPHRNIIRVTRCAQLPDGQWHIVMDYLDGGTLAALAASQGGPMSKHDVLTIFAQIGNGLFAAHNRGIVHRDLKLENIFLVQRDGNPRHVVILDFGIAHVPEKDGTTVTRAGMMAGTPTYMAPEQIRDLKSVDARTDIYALGVMLYQLVTGGWLPYQGDHETFADYCDLSVAQIYERQLTQSVVDPRRRHAGIDDRWTNIILSSLHPDPARRPQTAQTLVLLLAQATEPDAFSGSGVDIVREYARELLEIGNLLETVRGSRPPSKPVAPSRYQFGRLLGAGGMAEVVRGVMTGAHGFARDVAIKRVLPGFSNVAQFGEMFIQEARIASKLQHAAIVQVFDFDRDAEGRLFLVMEFVDGKDLNALREACLLSPSVIIFIMIEVLRALGYAHNLPVPSAKMRGVIHRDVSPHNILLSWEGDVKLSDFGIAKARQATVATASDQIKGKIAYMSPEQANGDELDGRADLWACGVVLHELLTGQPLFAGTTQEALAQVFHRSIPRPSQVRPGIPADLEAIANRLLQRDLASRYANADQVIEDLSHCADMPRNGRAELVRLLSSQFPEAIAARSSPDSDGVPSSPLLTSPPNGVVTATAKPRPSGTPVMPVPSTPTTLGSAAAQSVVRASRGSRWLVAGIISVAAIGGGVAAFVVNQQSSESSPSAPQPTVVATKTVSPADAPTELHVTIETKPAGATVLVDHEKRGTSPVTISATRGAHLELAAVMDGFADERATVAVDHDTQAFVLVLSPRSVSPPIDAGVPTRKPPRPATVTPQPPKRFDPNDVGGGD